MLLHNCSECGGHYNSDFDSEDGKCPKCVSGACRYCGESVEERDALRARVAELEKALREARDHIDHSRFCAFKCDCRKCDCGAYEVDQRIDALLSAPAQAPTADKKCECANPRSATKTLCWDCGRPLRDAPAPAKEEP